MAWISEADLTDILGRDMARTLTRTLGGQRVYVPRAARADHKLARAIGMRGMAALCAARPGEALELPNGREKQTARRRAEALLRQGATLAQAAEACCISKRYAERIAQDMRARAQAPQQGSLWG